VNLRDFAVAMPASEVSVRVDGAAVATTISQDGSRVVATFQKPLCVKTGQTLTLSLR
jgi:hypothetical protein